jgi:hypothetical protein
MATNWPVMASMGAGDLRRYALSCGLLLVPIFVWNAVLTDFLPGAWSTSAFWRDVPPLLANIENASRLVVAALPFLMPLEVNAPIQRRGLIVFGVGVVLYFASWLAVLLAPASTWSRSPIGFLAPAYTPVVWLLGIALVGQRLYLGRLYRWWMYLFPACVFLAAHVGHTALVYSRLQ